MQSVKTEGTNSVKMWVGSIALDVENVSNSVTWSIIIPRVKNMHVEIYLITTVKSYFRNGKIRVAKTKP